MKTSIDRAREYADGLRTKLGTRWLSVVLFGSQARGDAREGADYDFLVVVDKRTADAREAVLDAGVEMLNRYDQLFGALLYREDEWQEGRRFSIGWNIQREGIVL